jgi:hypothetical protein
MWAKILKHKKTAVAGSHYNVSQKKKEEEEEKREELLRFPLRPT